VTTYLLAGGGTAGHVNPLLAVADRLRARDPDATVLVLGTAEGLEMRLVPQRGYELLTIARVPFPRRPNSAALAFPRRLREAIDDVRTMIRNWGVDVVVGFGGYVAAPAYLAARAEGTPLVIHEANAKPGMANRLGARYTDHVGVAFRGTRIRGAEFVGMPLRPEIEHLDRFTARAEGVEYFGLDPERPVLLVTGGSSGAKRINDTISQAITLILGAGWQVIHVTGALREAVADPGLPGYHLVGYVDRMELALAVADLAIARAGTATVAELAGLGIPAVFVPYAVGNGEQRFNAREAVDAGGAVIVDDDKFDAAWIASDLIPLLGSRARIAEMAARMATVGTLDGTDRTVALIERALQGSTSRAK
jgi:UDP-N-acetylglucosamine--N-acetylmuramyl-(pentapeptide) pyrophosphoryl-undecaprenol N-acetylglucosamine transferase